MGGWYGGNLGFSTCLEKSEVLAKHLLECLGVYFEETAFFENRKRHELEPKAKYEGKLEYFTSMELAEYYDSVHLRRLEGRKPAKRKTPPFDLESLYIIMNRLFGDTLLTMAYESGNNTTDEYYHSETVLNPENNEMRETICMYSYGEGRFGTYHSLADAAFELYRSEVEKQYTGEIDESDLYDVDSELFGICEQIGRNHIYAICTRTETRAINAGAATVAHVKKLLKAVKDEGYDDLAEVIEASYASEIK